MPPSQIGELPEIPSINIVGDADDSRQRQTHQDGTLLSPLSPDSDAGSAPPSPTLTSHSTHHFQTSLALRDNKADEKTGLSSLALLSPENASSSGSSQLRRASNATSMTDVEGSSDNGRSDNDLRKSDVEDASADGADGQKDKKKKKKKGKKGDEEDDKTAHQRELEQDAVINPAPFHFKPYQLAHMLDPKNLDTLSSFGGPSGLVRGLGTHADHGLSMSLTSGGQGSSKHDLESGIGASDTASDKPIQGSEKVPEITLTDPSGDVSANVERSQHAEVVATFEDRRRVFGTNVLPSRSSKTLLQLMWLALKDKVLILLLVAAAISLALGIYQAVRPKPNHDEPAVEWVEGVAILLAVSIVVIVGSLNDWQKERQFRVLNDKKDERGVKVIRDGVEKVIDIKEVLVGDIALIEPGEIIPCDGVFLSGHNVKCDESGATGESDAIKKAPFADVLALYKNARSEGKDPHMIHTDCFMISGSKVLEGVGKYVVVAVGTKSFNGRIMMALRGDTENTPLQLKLNRLAELIAKIGATCGLVMFTALLIRFFVQLGKNDPPRTGDEKGTTFVNILIISVTLVVVAVPEGLPLAVTLALAFATKRMTAENLLVRVLGSCETMANASVVCTDKTGTLTTNVMSVVAGSVGVHCKFVRQLEDNAARTNADEPANSSAEAPRRIREDFSVDQSDLNKSLPHAVQDLFNEAIAINSTAFEDTNPETNHTAFVGSKTETALLQFAKELGWKQFRDVRENAQVVQMVPFSSERKAMGVVVKRPDGSYRFYIKGASEILSRRCNSHIVVNENGADGSNEVQVVDIDEAAQQNISRTIIFYANQTLRTLAVCYRDFPSWPPANARMNDDEVEYEDLSLNMTLIGIVGIEDPLREGVRESVGKCHRAGVTIKMCTGDNVLTARSIANQCGIFMPGGIIMEGPVFRKLTTAERIEIVPRLQVLARSSPEDKKVLVETLKSIGEVVGVTGDGTNDGPALKTANVGFSMGIAGTEVAKEASDIILMDDNFTSIVKAIMWGRCVNDAVRKFLQFQISTNVTAVVITFVSAVASEEEESVLSAVQLLWINIIMDTFAALALATDPATEELLDRKPDRKTAPLFSVDMYKMILMQSCYQIFIILLFHFKGVDFLGFEHTTENERIVKSLVFNAFVFAQIFNSVNCRRLDNKLNIFTGILKNPYFIVITLLEVVIQTVIMIVGGYVSGFGAAFSVSKIGGREWGISLALGFVSIPWGAVIRCMPNGPFYKLFDALHLFGREKSVLPTLAPSAEGGWGGAFTAVQDSLGTFANLRGGRLRSSSFAMKSRKARPSSESAAAPVSTIMTMAPTMIMAAAVAGGTYKQSGSLSDPAGADPSKSSAALWEGKLQIHPDTPADDPIYKHMPQSAKPSDP